MHTMVPWFHIPRIAAVSDTSNIAQDDIWNNSGPHHTWFRKPSWTGRHKPMLWTEDWLTRERGKMCCLVCGGSQKLGALSLGVLITRIMVYWGLSWDTLFMETRRRPGNRCGVRFAYLPHHETLLIPPTVAPPNVAKMPSNSW